jgi:3,4-dihydroxy 2-butanone 4-phosphate synthase/GTP cyclohydrolase II
VTGAAVRRADAPGGSGLGPATPADLAGTLEDCVRALRDGSVVVLTDRVRDIGVVGIAGARTTPVNVNFLIRHCRGIVYAGAPAEQLDRLGIGHQDGSDVLRAQTYVAVDAVAGVTTGVSAADRATTIRTIVDPATSRADLRTAGHVLPTVIDGSGRLEDFYFNEALHDLITLAGLPPGLALSAVLADDGAMASVTELARFADRHGAPCIDATDVVRARRFREGWPEPWPGQRVLRLAHFRTDIAITAVAAHERHAEFPVRLLPFCMVGHALRAPVPCRDQLEAALDEVQRRGYGAVVLAWPATRRGAATSAEECPHHRVNPALAGLVAAELAAGVPAASPSP